jgi:hypothetical protein
MLSIMRGPCGSTVSAPRTRSSTMGDCPVGHRYPCLRTAKDEGPRFRGPLRRALAAPLVTDAARRQSLRERLDAREEIWRLSVEQPHGGQRLRSAEGSALGVRGPDDRAARELPIEEACWLGHDPVGLEHRLCRVQVGEREPGGGVGQRRALPTWQGRLAASRPCPQAPRVLAARASFVAASRWRSSRCPG